MDPFKPATAIVGEAVAGQSATLRKLIKRLSGDLTKYTFDLAEAFLQAQESRCYHQWGFESLGEYAEIELGIKHRRAQYLARIARVCRDSGVTRADYEPAGVTKLRSITVLNIKTTHFNQETKQHEPMVDHIVRLIAEAPELSTAEVEAEVQRLMGNTGDNAMIPRMFKVTNSAWDGTVAPAIEAMRKQLGSTGRDDEGKATEYSLGTCIEYICRDWLNDPENFLEEPDESRVQIEVPLEGNNVTVEDQNVHVSADSSTDNREGGALDPVVGEEVLQEQLQGPLRVQVIPSE